MVEQELEEVPAASASGEVEEQLFVRRDVRSLIAQKARHLRLISSDGKVKGGRFPHFVSWMGPVDEVGASGYSIPHSDHIPHPRLVVDAQCRAVVLELVGDGRSSPVEGDAQRRPHYEVFGSVSAGEVEVRSARVKLIDQFLVSVTNRLLEEGPSVTPAFGRLEKRGLGIHKREELVQLPSPSKGTNLVGQVVICHLEPETG